MARISDAIRQYEQEIIHHIQALIRIRSVASEPMPGKPFGNGIDQALCYMLELGESMGFKAVNVNGYAGHIEYGQGQGLVAVLVHLDTVPEGNGWTYDPFGGHIEEGKLYGRGASDNKGPAVIALFTLKALKDLGVFPRKRIRIIFGTNEENGMTDMDYYFTKQPLPDYAFTPDAAYPIIHAEKGYYVIKMYAMNEAIETDETDEWNKKVELHKIKTEQGKLISVVGGAAPNVVPEYCRAVLYLPNVSSEGHDYIQQLAEQNKRIQVNKTTDVNNRNVNSDTIEIIAAGKSGHGSFPPSGINAIAHMAEFLELLDPFIPEPNFIRFLREAIGFEAFGESLGIACSDPTHGRLTVNLAQLALDENRAEAIINLRYPVGYEGDAIIQSLADRARRDGVLIAIEANMAPLFVASNHPLIHMLSRAYEMIMGTEAELLSIGGGTYARKLQNRGVAFGSGFRGTDTRAHQPDEFIPFDQMMLHAEICLQAVYEMLEMSRERSTE